MGRKKATSSEPTEPEKKVARYAGILSRIFGNHYRKGSTEFEFERTEFSEVADELNIELPKNLGDLIYSFRFRALMPAEITQTAPPKHEWVILLAGHGRYRMKLVRINRIVPTENKYEI